MFTVSGLMCDLSPQIEAQAACRLAASATVRALQQIDSCTLRWSLLWRLLVKAVGMQFTHPDEVHGKKKEGINMNVFLQQRGNRTHDALKAPHFVATRVILPQFRTGESSSLSVHV